MHKKCIKNSVWTKTNCTYLVFLGLKKLEYMSGRVKAPNLKKKSSFQYHFNSRDFSDFIKHFDNSWNDLIMLTMKIRIDFELFISGVFLFPSPAQLSPKLIYAVAAAACLPSFHTAFDRLIKIFLTMKLTLQTSYIGNLWCVECGASF